MRENLDHDDFRAACSVLASGDELQNEPIERSVTELVMDHRIRKTKSEVDVLEVIDPDVAFDERRAARWLVAITVCFASLLFGLVVRFPWPLFDPDESLFAVITQEMADTNQWIIPTYEGKPFLDRPAPYFWILRGCTYLFGQNESSYRIPNLLLGMGTAVATGGYCVSVVRTACGGGRLI